MEEKLEELADLILQAADKLPWVPFADWYESPELSIKIAPKGIHAYMGALQLPRGGELYEAAKAAWLNAQRRKLQALIAEEPGQ